MAPRQTRGQRSKPRLSRRREFRDGERLADTFFLHFLVAGNQASPKLSTFKVVPNSGGEATRVNTPELRRNDQQYNSNKASNCANDDNSLVAMVP